MIGLAVAMLVAGRILGVTELFGLAAAAGAVVAFGVTRVRSPRLRVALSAEVAPPVLSVGDPATLELSIENSGTVPTPTGRLHLVPTGGGDGPLVEVPRLVPGERATVSLRLPTGRRGRHEVAGFDAVLVDGLGTARRSLTRVGTSRYGVRPVAEPLSGAVPSGGGGADLETTRSSADRLRSGASLLRPYLPGDDLRRIHWPTTARIGDLMVREGGDRERDVSTGVTVVLAQRYVPTDRDGGADGFEEAVSAAASLLTAACSEGPFRLVVAGGADTGEAAGPRHLDTALETLTDVAGRAVRPDDGGRVPGLPKGALEERVVLFVGACPELALMATLFGAAPAQLIPSSSALVEVAAGAADSGLELVSRRHLSVSLRLGGSLEELWESGETAAVRL